jgi:protein-disulfide isomerase
MQDWKGDKFFNYLPLALALVVVGLLVVVLTSYDSSADKATASPEESRALKRTEALLAGIPQQGTVLGDPKAPVTLHFFGDLQCRQSRQVMLGALPFLIRHWVRGGELRVLFHSLRTDTPDPHEFMEQQIAALAAARQHKLWTFIDLFYREQRAEYSHYADDAFLERIAKQAGVTPLLWAEDRESEGMAGEIESDEVTAAVQKLHSTPSFLIGPTGGEAHPLRHFSLEETVVFDEAIRELL